MNDGAVVDSIRQSIQSATNRLRGADARQEALASFVPRRRVLLFTKSASFVPLGRVWRLGVFLLDSEGTLYAVGSTTRAVAPGYPGFQSSSAEERRGYRAAAFGGPFAPGETVNFAAQVIDLQTAALRDSPGPLFLADGKPLVRWTPSVTIENAVPFKPYLRERVDLLIEPPEGA